ncbi:MAG: hypothetical protein ABSF23_16325 [Terracidiphilus sp.]|jgi:hypothetical protein
MADADVCSGTRGCVRRHSGFVQVGWCSGMYLVQDLRWWEEVEALPEQERYRSLLGYLSKGRINFCPTAAGIRAFSPIPPKAAIRWFN